jgi:hypothetical protein
MCAFAAAEAVDLKYTPIPDRGDRGFIPTLHHRAEEAWSGASLGQALWMGHTEGWAAAVGPTVEVYERLTAKRLQSRIPVPVYMDEPGEEIDVAAYLSGDDCFISRSESSRLGAGRGAVRLRHSMFASFCADAEQIVTRGLIVGAIAHLLETSGVQVAIDLDFNVSGGERGETASVECELKGFGMALDLPRLAFWLAHPAVLRRIVFAVTARHFHTHYDERQRDNNPEYIRVGRALVGNPDAVDVAREALAQAGIELE